MRKLKLFLAVILLAAFITSSTGCGAFEAAQRVAENITEAANASPSPQPARDTVSPSAEPRDERATADMRRYRNKNSDTKNASAIKESDIWEPYKNPEQAADAAEEQRFTQYADNLITEIPALGVIDELFLFADPQAAGVSIADAEEDTTYREDWDEYYDTLHKISDELDEFDMSKLSRKSAITLQQLKDAVNTSLLDEDYYLIASDVLGLSSSFIELPNLIAEAPVRKEQDIEDLLDMIASLPETYEEYVEIEKDRQQAGVGMNSVEIELVLEELDRIITPRNNPVQSAIEETIDEAAFLTPERKAELKEQTAEYIKDYYIPAYEYVLDELSQIKGRSGTPGLAGAAGGADYYKILLQQMGIDLDPEAAQAYLLDEFYYYQDVSAMILMANPDYIDAFLTEGDNDLDFTAGMSSQEIVEYLEDAIKEDFKDVGEISYTVEKVPAELEMPDVAAFYLTKPLDAGNSEPAAIYINNESTDGDFITLAHEGFPGHMYQDAYQRTNGRPYALDLLGGYKAFTEGWGTYAQVIAANYAPDYQDYAYLLAIDEFMNGIVYAYMDIGINYLGWDKAQAAEEMEMAFGIDSESSEDYVDYMMEHLPTDPGTFVAYFLGAAKMLELRRIAEEDLGDKFNAMDFNSAILDIAPAPLSVIEAAVYNYIDKTLNGDSQSADAENGSSEQTSGEAA